MKIQCKDSVSEQESVIALAGVAPWVEQGTVNRKVAGLIPSQGTCLDCRSGPQLGAFERQPVNVPIVHQCFSPSFFLPYPLSKSK